jgi:hypothetical protein
MSRRSYWSSRYRMMCAESYPTKANGSAAFSHRRQNAGIISNRSSARMKYKYIRD